MAEDKIQHDHLKAKHTSVSAVWVCKDGEIQYEYAPYLPDDRWHGVVVDSSNFKKLPHPERLYQQSQAYLDAAIHLCGRAGDLGVDLQWPEASVCYWALHFSTELFLKACLLMNGSSKIAMNHDISGLLGQYRKLFPDPEFSWPTPWDISAKEIKEFFEIEELNSIDQTPDQLFKYGADKSGVPSAGLQIFAPSEQMGYLTYIKERWTQVWGCIVAKKNVQQ